MKMVLDNLAYCTYYLLYLKGECVHLLLDALQVQLALLAHVQHLNERCGGNQLFPRVLKKRQSICLAEETLFSHSNFKFWICIFLRFEVKLFHSKPSFRVISPAFSILYRSPELTDHHLPDPVMPFERLSRLRPPFAPSASQCRPPPPSFVCVPELPETTTNHKSHALFQTIIIYETKVKSNGYIVTTNNLLLITISSIIPNQNKPRPFCGAI